MSELEKRPRPGFLSGLSYPLRGARLVYFEHRGLARFWVPPILITTAVLVLAVWAALHYRSDLMQLLWQAPTGEGAVGWLQRALHTAVQWLLALLLVGASVVSAVLLSSVIAAPFNDALSEAIEQLHGRHGAGGISLGKLAVDVARTVGLEAMKLGGYLAVMLPLFIVSLLVPGIGSAIYSVTGFVLTSLFLSLDYVDWPAARRQWPLRRRLAVARRHIGPMLGLGMGIWVLMFVPLLNLFFMPAAVAGGTLMFLDLHELQDSSGM